MTCTHTIWIERRCLTEKNFNFAKLDCIKGYRWLKNILCVSDMSLLLFVTIRNFKPAISLKLRSSFSMLYFKMYKLHRKFYVSIQLIKHAYESCLHFFTLAIVCDKRNASKIWNSSSKGNTMRIFGIWILFGKTVVWKSIIWKNRFNYTTLFRSI